MNLRNICKKVGYIYISPDPQENVLFQPLHFQYVSFSNYIQKLNDFFNITREISSKNHGSWREVIKLSITDLNITPPHLPYNISALDGIGYESCICFTVKIDKHIIKQSDTPIEIINIITHGGIDNNLIKIPMMVTYKGRNCLELNSPIEYYEPGCIFINNRSIEKIGLNIISKINVWPKIKSIKSTVYTASFSSSSLENILFPSFQYFKLILDVNNPKTFDLSSKKTFINVNIILLIKYLTNFTDNTIEACLTYNAPNNIKKLVKYIIVCSNELMKDSEITNNSKSVLINTVDEYMNNVIKNNYEMKDKLKIKKDISFNEYKENIFRNFLPHMYNYYNQYKGLFLIDVIKKMLLYIYYPNRYPDRDSLMCKDTYTSGKYFEQITSEEINNICMKLSDNFNKMDNKINKNLIENEEKTNYSYLKDAVTISPNLQTATNSLLNGKFKKTDGAFRSHSHYSYIQSIYTPRNILNSIDQIKTAKSFTARELNESHCGFLDFSNIPDHGAGVGLITELTIHTYITNILHTSFTQLYKQIFDFIYYYFNVSNESSVEISHIIDGVPIFIENIYIGSIHIDKADNFINQLRRKKREYGAFVAHDFGVTYIREIYIRQIKINIRSGRLVRPVLVIEDGKLLIENYLKELDDFNGSISDLRKMYPSILEIIDVEQFMFSELFDDVSTYINSNDDIRKTKEYCEFPLEFRCGYTTSCLKGINHNAGIRSIFGCAQVKQAASCLTADVTNKIDNGIHLLYPDRALLSNKALEISKIAEHCFGHYVMIALFSYKGLNQEDAICVKKESSDRGLLAMIIGLKFTTEVHDSSFTAPVPKHTENNYSKLNETGIVDILSVLEAKDAYTKNIQTRNISNQIINDNQLNFDSSTCYSELYCGRVQRTFIEYSDKVKIRILTMAIRNIEQGDKCTTVHGQKGVVSCLISENELPYDEYGNTPDIMINSTAIVARKTIWMLVDGMLTNAYISKPYYHEYKREINICDVLSINDIPLKDNIIFIDKCHKWKYPDISEEDLLDMRCTEYILYNPMTHKPYTSKTYFAPMYYLRLRHTPVNKSVVRNRGPISRNTKQPNEGRKNGGAVKIGEMERDAFIAHGAAYTCCEILKDITENRCTAYICEVCGRFAEYEENKYYSRHFCHICSSQGLTPTLILIETTHVHKIIHTILEAKGIKQIPIFSKIEAKYHPRYLISM